MPETWTSEIVAEMHLHRVTQKKLAEALSWTPVYLNMVLNGKRSPKNAESSVKTAMKKIIDEQKEG